METEHFSGKSTVTRILGTRILGTGILGTRPYGPRLHGWPGKAGAPAAPREMTRLDMDWPEMDRLELKRHRQSGETGVASVSAGVAVLRGGDIAVSYRAEGDMTDVAAPFLREGAGARRDNLWRATCFELFAGFDNAPFYWEVNLSPSTDWSVYRFSVYRRGMRNEGEARVQKISFHKTDSRLAMEARLHLGGVAAFHLKRARFGLSAIIRDRSDHKSYWALEHPRGAPDFHHRACFSYKPHQE